MSKNVLNGLTFTEQQLAQYQSVSEVVNNRFNRWIVSRKIANPLDDQLINLSDGISEINKKIEKERDNERQLLEIEKQGQERRIQLLEAKKDLLQKVTNIFQARLYKSIRAEMEDTDKIIKQNLKIPEDISHLLEHLFSASVTYNKIWSGVCAVPGLDIELAKLVNDERFCNSIGRQPPTQKVNGKEAVGFLGIDGCKVVISLLLIKARIRMKSEHFPLSNEKLWAFIVTVGNVATNRLKSVGYREPIQGFLLAGCALLGHIAILNLFDTSFKTTKHDLMVDLRDRNSMDMYFVAPNVKAHPVVLAELFVQDSTAFSESIMEAINWKHMPHLRDAVIEENTRTKMTERSLFGQVLRQAIHFGKFVMLKESRQISTNHVRPYLFGAYLDPKTINELLKSNVKTLSLREFME